MTRIITSSILAASIIFGSFSVSPAQAGNKDVGRILAGALTLAIIAKVIEDNKSSRRNNSGAAVSKNYYGPTPLPGPVRMKRLRHSLPGECLFNVRTKNGKRAVFGKLCLRETTRFVNRLPSACEDRIRVRYGRRADVYDAKCLRKRGYQVARYAR
ncbi:MAG: hypothetical protein KUG58_03940 [Marinosulfonomonas sp.]|nr:hypothetical protein [Marinosulfonomonas sp.]